MHALTPSTLADQEMLVPGLADHSDETRFAKYDGMALYEAVQKTQAQVGGAMRCRVEAPLTCQFAPQLHQRLRNVDGCLMCAQELTAADFKSEVAEFKSYAKTQRMKRAKVEAVSVERGGDARSFNASRSGARC